jgi:hypothetical protein
LETDSASVESVASCLRSVEIISANNADLSVKTANLLPLTAKESTAVERQFGNQLSLSWL